ncbi:NAD(P)/FAD-dependent oxidoreductase [Candidatus Micrarchaeota archaeon]|nr:NAD(P)/FAD-dependent oxidoreductase [Candidatus Micrarchaeota archaeon]
MYDVIIIGAGPAGIAAAIQLKRAGTNIILLERKKVGGLLNNASLIENYPGFPAGIFGADLVRLFQKQLEVHNIKPQFLEVKSIDNRASTFFIKTNHKTFCSKTIIIASGSIPKKLNGEVNLSKRKLFYDLDQLSDVEGKTINIIGSGDIAFDYAINVANAARQVNLFIKNKTKCIPILYKRALKKQNIKIYKFGKFDSIPSDHTLVAIGREKKLPFISKSWQDLLANDSDALEKLGIFLAGDIKLQNFRHTAIAVGDGLNTAIKVGRFLSCQSK